jgi:hypothetical protein
MRFDSTNAMSPTNITLQCRSILYTSIGVQAQQELNTEHYYFISLYPNITINLLIDVHQQQLEECVSWSSGATAKDRRIKQPAKYTVVPTSLWHLPVSRTD